MKNKVKEIKNIDLKKLSSMHIGGKAKSIFYPKNIIQINNILKYGKKLSKKCIILGNCTNIIFHDKTYDDIFISMKEFDKLECDGETVTCGAGVNLFVLCMFCQRHGLSGLEFAYGIPGSLGGAVAMNAGAFGGEICSQLESITVFVDGEIRVCRDLKFDYRKGPLADGEILIEAKFKLKRSKSEEIFKKQVNFLNMRKISQPNEPSCGSVFKRSGDVIPAKLIDEWGLKGLRVGGAAISDKHAGFVINRDGATFEDVKTLIEIVEWIAKNKGYAFKREIKIL